MVNAGRMPVSGALFVGFVIFFAAAGSIRWCAQFSHVWPAASMGGGVRSAAKKALHWIDVAKASAQSEHPQRQQRCCCLSRRES